MLHTPDLDFMNTTEAAKFLGISYETLRRWVRQDTAPPRRQLGKRYYYQQRTIMQWLESPQPSRRHRLRVAFGTNRNGNDSNGQRLRLTSSRSRGSAAR